MPCAAILRAGAALLEWCSSKVSKGAEFRFNTMILISQTCTWSIILLCQVPLARVPCFQSARWLVEQEGIALARLSLH